MAGDSWNVQKIGQAVICGNVKYHMREREIQRERRERERGPGWIDDGVPGRHTVDLPGWRDGGGWGGVLFCHFSCVSRWKRSSGH